MTEQLLAMSGDFDNEFESYLQANHVSVESAALTIVECNSESCTVILC